MARGTIIPGLPATRVSGFTDGHTSGLWLSSAEPCVRGRALHESDGARRAGWLTSGQHWSARDSPASSGMFRRTNAHPDGRETFREVLKPTSQWQDVNKNRGACGQLASQRTRIGGRASPVEGDFRAVCGLADRCLRRKRRRALPCRHSPLNLLLTTSPVPEVLRSKAV